MFYQQLIDLCEREGVKPTPLIKSLGFSAGNIRRWENGATVNSDILLAISEHFKVSIDYLLTGNENQVNELTPDEQKLLENYNKLTDSGKKEISKKAEELAADNNSDSSQNLKPVHVNSKEKEMMRLFRSLSNDEQMKLLGRAELLAEQANLEESAG